MKRINIEVSDELVAWKEKQGIRWRALAELGKESIDLRFERNRLLQDLERVQKANAHLQNEIFRLNEEVDAYKAGVKP